MDESLSSKTIEKCYNHNKAKYFLECVFAKLHGVNFDNSNDFLEDKENANRTEVKALQGPFTLREKEMILTKDMVD